MYLLIEHNGSKPHTLFANKVQEYLEDEFGATVEQIVGSYEDSLKIYNINLVTIGIIEPNEPLEKLNYFIEDIDE